MAEDNRPYLNRSGLRTANFLIKIALFNIVFSTIHITLGEFNGKDFDLCPILTRNLFQLGLISARVKAINRFDH